MSFFGSLFSQPPSRIVFDKTKVDENNENFSIKEIVFFIKASQNTDNKYYGRIDGLKITSSIDNDKYGILFGDKLPNSIEINEQLALGKKDDNSTSDYLLTIPLNGLTSEFETTFFFEKGQPIDQTVNNAEKIQYALDLFHGKAKCSNETDNKMAKEILKVLLNALPKLQKDNNVKIWLKSNKLTINGKTINTKTTTKLGMVSYEKNFEDNSVEKKVQSIELSITPANDGEFLLKSDQIPDPPQEAAPSQGGRRRRKSSKRRASRKSGGRRRRGTRRPKY